MASIRLSTILSALAVMWTSSMVYGFDDVKHHFFRPSIVSLSSSGIVSGYDERTFGPQNPITRAELLKILLSRENTELIIDPLTCFSDITADSWQKPYVCTAKSLGYTN